MQRVFRRKTYLALALGVTIVVFLSIVWVPDLPLISLFLFDPSLSPAVAFHLASGLLVSSFATAHLSFLAYSAFTALLIAINSALFTFYIRFYRIVPSLQSITSGTLGSFFALLGFGCVSCGSIFFTAFFAAASGTGILATAPYLGVGVGIVGIVLLLLSALFLARTISTPPICPV